MNDNWIYEEHVGGVVLVVAEILLFSLIFLDIWAYRQRKAIRSAQPTDLPTTRPSRWARRWDNLWSQATPSSFSLPVNSTVATPGKRQNLWTSIQKKLARSPTTYPSKWDVELEEVGRKDESVSEERTVGSRDEMNYPTRLEPLIEPKYRGMDFEDLKARRTIVH